MTPLETQVVLMLFASFVTEFTSNSMAATLLVPVVSELVSVCDPERKQILETLDMCQLNG